MTWQAGFTLILGIVVFAVLIKPLGTYLYRVFTFQPTALDRVFRPGERWLFKRLHISADQSMSAVQYGLALILTNFIWVILAYLFLRIQNILPFNPEHFAGLSPGLSFNTSASFTANTDWQAYSGENTMSLFSQVGVLQFLMFATPATGGAAAMAVMRALAGKPLGNFFVDLTLMVTRVFLPLAMIFGLVLLVLGVPESWGPYRHIKSLAGPRQTIPQGPLASWESIEHLGQNGGGFTNANSANPLENPTAWTNFVETIAMGIVPMAFLYTFGLFIKKIKLAWILIGVSAVFLAALVLMVYLPEVAGNPIITALGLHGHSNWTGLELHYGLGGSGLFTGTTMATATGSVNTAIDSLPPIAVLAAFIGMFTNLIFGATGAGLLSMLMLVFITVFIIGLMVGRTPEFLGKKIEAKEVSIAAAAFLLHPLLILVGTAIGAATPAGMAGIYNGGPQGLMEILYGFSSGAANNGSAMGGLGASLPFYEVGIGIVMLLNRYLLITALLIIGDSLRKKQRMVETAGTLQLDTGIFGVTLAGSILILNALTFFPVVALGPLAEQYLMAAHHLFR